MEDKPVWLIALIFFLFVLVPIGSIWSGIKLAYKNFRFRKNAVLVAGKVVETNEVLPHLQHTGATKFQLLFEFRSPAGEVLRGETVTGSIKNKFALHSEHEILVNFGKPGTVNIPGDRNYLKAIAMIVIGGTVLFAGGSFMLSLS